MFDALSDRFSSVFERLKKRAVLKEADIDEAMREVRVALLEADVALPVVKDFIAEVRKKALGGEVLRSVSPGQMVVKIVHDHLVTTLGVEKAEIDLNAPPPVVVMMVGLQGSGKTTTTAKIALRLKTRDKKKALMASLDVRRPAAQEQLKVLGEQAGVATLPVIAGQMPLDIARRALSAARLQGADVVLLDTAGRLAIDESLMAELAAIRDATGPTEILLVADALTGQDAVNTARAFNERLSLTGIALTRIDGDGRGGAALSMRAVTGCPIKLMGTGESLTALEEFHPERIASRILGMGDVVSLVEKAAETIDREDAEKLAAKMKKGELDFDDLASQLRQMRKLGGMSGVLGMLPGVAKIKSQLAGANLDDSMLRRQEAIIQSMTPSERRIAKVLNASRKRRIAAGSGASIQDVNRLLKMQKSMGVMMKQMRKMGKSGRFPPGMGGMGGGGLGGLGGPGGFRPFG